MCVYYVEGTFSTRHRKIFRVEAKHSYEALDKVKAASDSEAFWNGAVDDSDITDASFCVIDEPADASLIHELGERPKDRISEPSWGDT